MPVNVYKRIIKRGEDVDVSLVPITSDDLKKIKKLPSEKPVEITMKSKRQPESLRQLWACVHFVYDHHPEHWNDYWNSYNELYDWLKFNVGWTITMGAGDQVYRYPRPTNFTEEKSEEEFVDKFQKPALKKLADIMEYQNSYELCEAAITWSKMKRDKVF